MPASRIVSPPIVLLGAWSIAALLWCALPCQAQRGSASNQAQVAQATWPQALREYANEAPESRDAWIRRNSYALCDMVHRFLREASGPGTTAEIHQLARDLMLRAGRIHDHPALEAEWQSFDLLSAEVRAKRHDLLARANAKTRAWAEAAEPAAIAGSRSEALEVVDSLEAFGRKHDDRDLLRRAARLRTFLISGSDQPTGLRLDAAEALTQLLKSHGFTRDRDYMLAQLQIAKLSFEATTPNLLRIEQALAKARKATPRNQREGAIYCELLSLELEYFQQRGHHSAAATTATDLKGQLSSQARDILTQPTWAQPDLYATLADQTFQVAFALSANGAHSEAAKTLRQALTLPVADPWYRARICVLLAQEDETLGQFEQGDQHASEALRALAHLPDAELTESLRWQALLLRASCQALRGRVAEASRHLRSADALRSEAGTSNDAQRLSQRHALVEALVLGMNGNLEGALRSAERASVVKGDTATSENVQALWMHARLLMMLGEQEEALDRAYTALEWSKTVATDRRWQTVCSQIAVSDVLISSGRSGEALAHLSACQSVHAAFFEARPVLRGEVRRLAVEARWRIWEQSLKESSEANQILGSLDQAISDLKLAGRARLGAAHVAAEVLRSLELRQEIEISLRPLRPLARAKDDADHYWDSVRRSVPPKDRKSLGWKEAECIHQMICGRDCEIQNQGDDAFAHYQRAAALEEQLRHSLSRRAPDGLSRRFETVYDRMAAALLRTAAKLNSPARTQEALTFLESIRAQSLRTILRTPRTNEEGAIGTIVGPAPFTPKDLSAIAAKDRLILVYSLTSRGAFVIASKGDELRTLELGKSRESIAQLTIALRSNLEGAPNRYKAQALRQYGRDLYGVLIAPVEDLLEDCRELIIVPDQATASVPFGLLQPGEIAAELDSLDFSTDPLLLRRASLQSLVTVPSLMTLRELGVQTGHQDGPQGSILLAGAPGTLGDLPPLPFAEQELEKVASIYDKDESTLLIGKNATIGSFLRADPSRHRVIHIATHSDPRLGSERAAALLFAGADQERPGVLTCDQILSWDLSKVGLVVLSSCGSAQGVQAGAEGVIGLPRAFLGAGADAVLATLTPVVDQKSSTFMTTFHHALQETAHPASSLLRTQRGMLAQPESSWPGYWAPYILLGRP